MHIRAILLGAAEVDGLETAAPGKRLIADGGHAAGDGDAGHGVAPSERAVGDLGDRQAVDRIGDDDVAAVAVVAGDAHRGAVANDLILKAGGDVAHFADGADVARLLGFGGGGRQQLDPRDMAADAQHVFHGDLAVTVGVGGGLVKLGRHARDVLADEQDVLHGDVAIAVGVAQAVSLGRRRSKAERHHNRQQRNDTDDTQPFHVFHVFPSPFRSIVGVSVFQDNTFCAFLQEKSVPRTKTRLPKASLFMQINLTASPSCRVCSWLPLEAISPLIGEVSALALTEGCVCASKSCRAQRD